MEQEVKTPIILHEFVAYYRELRPEKFSDSKIEYEIPLTKELFEKQLEILSTKKMQSKLSRFIRRWDLGLQDKENKNITTQKVGEHNLPITEKKVNLIFEQQ